MTLQQVLIFVEMIDFLEDIKIMKPYYDVACSMDYLVNKSILERFPCFEYECCVKVISIAIATYYFWC